MVHRGAVWYDERWTGDPLSLTDCRPYCRFPCQALLLIDAAQVLFNGESIMFGQKPMSDKDLLKVVNQRLSRTGTGSNSKVTASIRQGTVTLTGSLNYEFQRNTLMKAASRAEGVRQVIDQMQLAVKKKC